MAQLKDSIVSGDLRVTDTAYTDTLQADFVKAHSSASATDYTTGTAGQVLKSNGTSGGVYWANDNNSGDVTGPSSATVNDIATFNNANGKVIKDSGYTFSTGSSDTTATHIVLCNDSRLSNSRTPTSHTHGNIANGGTISSTVVTPASTDYILISDTSASGKIERGIAIGANTSTKFLREDGSWQTPAYPTVYDKKLTFKLGTTDKGNFTANSASDKTVTFTFTAGTTPSTVTKKTVVTGCTKKTVVTDATFNTVVNAVTFNNGVLSFGTGVSGTKTTGDSCTVTTGDSVTVTAGTAPSLSMTVS